MPTQSFSISDEDLSLFVMSTNSEIGQESGGFDTSIGLVERQEYDLDTESETDAPSGRTPFATEAGRLEAFSDGVIAVIITVMVLDLHPPEGTNWQSLHALLPTFAAYALSFVFVGIYWNNHHHMLRASRNIDGRAMWANLHLLFWLSLAPFTTSWIGAHPSSAVPTALYGLGLLLDAIAYTLLQKALAAVNGRDSAFARAVKTDWKGTISPLLYLAGIGVAFVAPAVSDGLFVAVAAIWIVPERRFEPVISRRP